MANVPLPPSPTGTETDIVAQTLTQLTTDVGNQALDGSDNVKTEQQSPVAIEDASGSPVSPPGLDDHVQVSDVADGTGSANAAAVDLESMRENVDVFYDVTGAATVTVEVSKDGSTWRPFHEESVEAAGEDVLQFSTAYRHARAYVDANLTTLEVVGR